MRQTNVKRKLFFIRVAMELMVDIAEAFVGDVRVNLGGGNVTVAQKFLNAAKIDSLIH